MAEQSFKDALKRYGGMYGEAWDGNGNCLYEAVEVGAAKDIGRIEVPLVGTTRVGFKRGRESNEGSLRVQKIDAKWELFVWKFTSQSLRQRREARGTPDAGIPTFTLKLVHDDPDAGGREVWQLDGCQIWRLTLGISITDDIVEREYPLTWEEEYPLEAYEYDAQGNIVPKYTVGG